MNYAAILAGGTGARMGNMDKPKQYLDLAGKPIIVYTVEKFLTMPDFDEVLVLCPEAWIESTHDILRKHLGENPKLVVLQGGKTRDETVMNAIKYIEDKHNEDEDAVICTHDSVRPFVTYRIIRENLKAMEEFDACDTVIPATDTIVESAEGVVIDSIPERSRMYQGQTPQTFKVSTLKRLYAELTDDERAALTDACKVCVLRGTEVALVQGETYNVKITYPSDMKMAAALLGMED